MAALTATSGNKLLISLAAWRAGICLAPCLAYDTAVGENPFYKQLAIWDWVEAGILYAACSAHQDGSCDDYFPMNELGRRHFPPGKR